VSDLISLAKGAPALALALAILSAVLYAAERVFALSGPMSKLVRWWRGRELGRLRREAELRAEQRRIQREEETAVMADLRTQVDELMREVGRLRTVVRSSEAHHRVMRDWADGLLRSARAAGLTYVDPPATEPLPAIPSPAPAPV
jgi:hypothetical protein